MKTIKIFLASSEELKHERLVIAEHIVNMNRRLADRDVTLRLVKWEYLDSSMGAQHKQEDYNDYLVDCDMCFALFWTKFGMYTEMEFEKSLKELNSKGSIRHLSVLFKDSTAKCDELRAFEKKCSEEYPALCHTFVNDDTLKEIITAGIEGFLSDKSCIDRGMKESGKSKSALQTIRIFLSIDKDLEQERLELMDLVENLNHSLASRNANILMIAWDNSAYDNRAFDDEISKTDLCLNLYYINFNNTTQTELESAYQALCDGRNPKKIYVYFKDGDSVPEELQEFRDSFPTKYGHFYCSYSNIDTLKADFLLQFMEFQSKRFADSKLFDVQNGKVLLDGKEYVDLINVPFAGNNEEYQLLQKSIKKTQKLLAITETDDPDYSEYAKDLNEMKEKVAKMESSLWETALKITQLSTTKCSERLERAMQLFNKGDNKGALAVLNEEEIEKDAKHAIEQIILGEEISKAGRETLKFSIQENELKVLSLSAEMNSGWLQKVIRLRENILEWTGVLHGTESREYVLALHDLSLSLEENGNYSDALKYYRIALDLSNGIYGEKDLTACLYRDMGTVFHSLGDCRKSLEYDLQAMAICKEVYGEKHPFTADYYNSVAGAYDGLGDYEKSMEFCQKALAIREKVYGEKDPSTAMSYNNIGILYRKLKDDDRSLKYHFKALAIQEEIHGEKHPDTALSYYNIGIAYLNSRNYEKSLEYHLKALAVYKEVYGEKHPKTADSYNKVADAYLLLEDFEPKALEYYLKALAIREEVYGAEHTKTVETYGNIADYYFDLQEYAKSLELRLKILTINEKKYGEVHPDTADSYNDLGSIYEKLGDYEESLKYYLKALRVREEIYQETHSDGGHSDYFHYFSKKLKKSKHLLQIVVKHRQEAHGSEEIQDISDGQRHS